MEHIGVIGLTWRQGGAEGLARFALGMGALEEASDLARLQAAMDVSELVFLSTCNRVEIYFRVHRPEDMPQMRARAFAALVGEPGEAGEAERCMRAWAGEGAAEHLFLVATGLDSAKVGETEISGQLKRSLTAARAAGLLFGGPLDGLMGEALRLSKRIRAATGICHGKTSLAEIGLEKAKQRLGQNRGPVALVGAAPWTERCAAALAEMGTPLVLVNRTVAHAERLATRLRELPGAAPVQVLGLDEFRREPSALEVLITATGAPDAVLFGEALRRTADACASGAALLVIDFAVPADVPEDQARALGIERVGMDAMLTIAEQSRAKRLGELANAREEIDIALERLRCQTGDAQVAPLVSVLQRRYREVARRGAERLLATGLADLTGDQGLAVKRFAESLAGHFAHLPSTGLRGVARVGGAKALDAFWSHADAELAKEFELARSTPHPTNPPGESHEE